MLGSLLYYEQLENKLKENLLAEVLYYYNNGCNEGLIRGKYCKSIELLKEFLGITELYVLQTTINNNDHYTLYLNTNVISLLNHIKDLLPLKYMEKRSINIVIVNDDIVSYCLKRII